MKTLITAAALALTAFSASAMVDTSAIEQYAPNADISVLTEAEVKGHRLTPEASLGGM